MARPGASVAALFAAIMLTISACGNPSGSDAPGAARSADARSGYASVGDLRMYYDIQGEGRPLVLLHGGTATIEYSFAGMRPALAQRWTTIAVEQQAHGHTADIDRPLRFEQMADDTAATLRELNIENADVFGWSDGGNVALALALRHPALVRKVAIFGTNANNEGLRPEIWTFMQQAEAQDEAAGEGETPPGLRESQERAAPNSWPNLVAKVMDQAVAFEGWSPQQLSGIRAPVLVMIGDRDIVRPEHAAEIYALMPNAQLAVLPGVDHFAPVNEPDKINALITAFFEAPMAEAAAR
jgi:pimeloyl-ACP methyl ester carboxylesterase